ncbi:intercellular adhesion molecule 5 isoform X4 [Conger conger]|uniref:intercellular adhesion molecule 5 isoform X4 n=1 Tax=Conger conger TaxID=82655 RepID=UPI002A59D359|nr:intercellular adhesion molecule 5 isoform X4 [Conger conger]
MTSEQLLWLLLVLRSVVCNDSDPMECPLMIQPPRVVVRHGDPVSVNCTISGDHDGMGWEASEGSVDKTEGVQFLTWGLETLTEWDIRPKCFGDFRIAPNTYSECDKRLNITVYKPPDSVSISVVDHKGPMLEGKQYQLQCKVQNIAPVQYLTVKWYKGETLYNETAYDDLTKTPVNVSSTLLITPISADDGAQYSCVAELELGPEGPQPSPEVKSDPLSITVLYKPRITECPAQEKLRESETLDTLVSCRAEGNPSPMVTWYIDQSEFNSSTPLTKRDGGQYTFIAKNSYGTANHTLEIEVLYPPTFELEREEVNVTQGDEVILECLAEGNPTPELTWNTTAAENPHVSTRGRQSNATISRATSANAGVYTCYATNNLGTASKTVTVTVKETDAAESADPMECPLMIQPPRVVVRHGDPVSVNCTVSGDHDGIGWEASQGSVDKAEVVQFVTWGLKTLREWDIRPKCFGDFLIAPNTYSECDKRLNITVYKPPDSVSISVVDHKGPMLEGKQYQLQCKVQNIAPVQYLTVKWYKGETLYKETAYDDLTKTPVNVSSTFLITPISADDGAQYSCVAELELGPEGPQPSPEVKSDPLSITVLYKPRITECPAQEKLRESETLDTLVSCRAEGNPSPMVTWYRDQSEFNSSTPLTKRDGGQYTLIAKNSYGAANHTLQIEVLYPPTFELEREEVNVTHGEEVILECLAEGNPTPELTWNTTAAENPHVSTRGRQSNATISISRATSANASVYTCYATNNLGTASKTFTVTVKETDAAESDPMECPLMIQPPRVVVRHGDPVSVNCTVSGDHDGIGWEASQGSVDRAEGVQFVTWGLKTLREWDIRPKCFGDIRISPNTSSECDKRLNITVYKPPDSVSISVVDHKGPMLEGKQYQLQCKVQNIAPVQYLTVKWYKGETLYKETAYDDLTKTPVNVSSTFLITPISADDGAQYSCVAELELGPEGPQPSPEVKSDPLSITVLYKPRITECPAQEKLRESETLDTLVSCRAEGNPSPMVTWYIDQSEFNSSTPLTKRDGGQYTLIAKNSYGAANHTLQIEVLYPPTFELEREEVNVTHGEEVILECLAEGNPTPELTWNTTAAENPHVSTRGRQSNATISISRATSANASVYTCYATNNLGTASKTFTVTVKETDAAESADHMECPLMIQPPRVVVRHGDPVSVNCTVSGDHDGIGWEASQGSVDRAEGVQFVTWGLKTLREWDIRPKCFGDIRISPNTSSECDKRLNITVYKPPDSVSISVVDHKGPMLEGKQYQLQCKVQNIAPVQYLTVKWYKGETLYNETSYDDLTKTPVNVSSTLLITPTSADDGAQYSCVAELELGPEGPQPSPEVKSDPLSVPVLYPPKFDLERKEVNITQGDEVILECLVEGNPTPELTWNTTAAENPHVSTRGRQSNATISISRATSANAGVYTCYATNNLGTASKTFTVTVKETDAAKRGYIHFWIFFFVVIFILVVLLLWIRKRLNRQGVYNVTPRSSAGRREESIPLAPCNGNGSSSCT